jgi:ligand-binding sensor domain-containing protein
MHASDDSTSLQSNAVNKLFVDSKGVLWIGTWEGLDRFDPLTEQFHHYNTMLTDTLNSINNGNYSINQIYEDHHGILW